MEFLKSLFYTPQKIQKIQKTKSNFYYLTLVKNSNVVYGYSIHGFWPNYSDGTYPSFCKKVDFDMEKLKPIMQDLIQFWESYNDVNKEEPTFWKHEWEKHGSCMFIDMSEYEYFKKTLDLYKDIINKEGIDIEKYKKGNNYMIPIDLNFNIICV